MLEGFIEFIKAGHTYRLPELRVSLESTEEFILQHQLFLSDRTGEIINKDFLRLSFPGRWRYDILPALDYFRYAGRTWDSRMQAAMDVLLHKRRADGTWNLQAAHPGQVHVEMEKAGKPSRWNTLRALRVLKHFGIVASAGTVESDEADVLALLIEDYESRYYPIEAPDPIEAIKIRMEELQLKQKDIAPVLGGKNRASEILNRKRKLTLDMIRKLSESLNLSVSLLIQEYKTSA